MIFSRRSLPASVLAASLACGGSTGSEGVPAPDALGPDAVGHESVVFVDAARAGRALPVEIWYPADAQEAADAPRTRYPLAPFIGLPSENAVEGAPVDPRGGHPLLLFSHGYGGISTQSIALMETLASHGFVVASPEHTGNSQASPGDDFDTAAGHRVPDISFVIDEMLRRSARPGDRFHDRIDGGRIGVVGHSFGGMTAVGMAAGWAGAEPDPRVRAIAPISAVIDGDLQADDRPSPNAGFDARQLARIAVPVMLIGGTEDTDVPIENNAIAFAEMVSTPVRYRVDVIGANHTHFANVCVFGELLEDLGLGPFWWPLVGAGDLLEPFEATCTPGVFPIEEAIRLQKLYVVSFFKLHLDDARPYGRFLSSARAEREPSVQFSVR